VARLCVGGVLVPLVLAAILGTPVLGAQSASGRILDLLNRYDRGDYQGSLAELDGPNGREKLRTAYAATAEFWVRTADPELVWSRTLVAASLALDLARDLKRSPGEPWRGAPVVLWACDLLRRHAPPTPAPAERWWYLASIAELEAHQGWPILIGRKDAMALSLSLSPDNSMARLAESEDEGGHVGHALDRFPDEPRFALARIEAREQVTAFLAAPVLVATSPLAQDGIPPSGLTDLQRLAAITVAFSPHTPEEQQMLRDRAAARLSLARASLVPGLTRDLEAVARFAEVRGEAELHLGYLDARRQAWTEALAHLDQVAGSTNDRRLLMLTDYFEGWTAQQLGRHESAIEIYQRALTRTPGARWASWPLAAELLTSGRATARDDARTVLNATLASKDDAEPLVSYYVGDAPRLADYLSELHAALLR
jgi:tetratricopeptide (TPR) repeat protein